MDKYKRKSAKVNTNTKSCKISADLHKKIKEIATTERRLLEGVIEDLLNTGLSIRK